MAEHKITREKGKGTDRWGYTDWEQVVCSCGYRSPKVENYNNYKHYTLLDYESNHLRQVRLLEAQNGKADKSKG